MIAVETVIKKMVSDYEFVIIPGFGALLSRQVPAFYDKDSGIFAPPVKKLAFNEFLKLDDGFLANYISREEKIAHTDAVTRIRQYTDNLKSALTAKGETSIEGVGSFNTNGEGKLVFEPSIANCFKDDWYGFSKVSVQPIQLKETVKIEAPQLSLKESDVEVLELNSRSKVTVNWLKWGSAAALAGLMFYVSVFLITSGNVSNKSTLNPFDFSDEKSETTVVDQPEKIVVAEEKVPVPVVVEKTPEVIKSAVAASPEVSEAVSVKPVVKADQGKRFYLIAGTFNGNRRANILLADLQQKGFSKALVLPAREGSKKVKVAVQGFEQESEAYAASAKLKSVIGEPGWVLELK
ncbi:SPOR domain-containing protein [Dyadobacter sp. CY312]|uniref:HU domain-containing protein n=1 Tax=Dyadobacter sp. CY312 TaxID=2907303 RepID=UPI001F239168|nr:SPOR domain-containing protein [Dyadobacter sp. CY312]MCE7039313.1 SPOR domain-containing protein [Dyadobacter sp. CY312]